MTNPNTAAPCRRFFTALLLAGAAGCSSSSPGDSPQAPAADSGVSPDAPSEDAGGDDAAADIDVPTESADTSTRGTSTTSLTTAKGVSELFVQEDPTINPSLTAAQNADAIEAQVQSKLGADAGACADAQISHAQGSVTVTVSFGTGCTVPSLGLTISGSASATVSKLASTITIAFVFTNLDVNGLTIEGTASEATTDGTSYTSHIDVTESTKHVVFDGTAALDANDAGVTLNGTGSYQDGAAPSMTYTATSVHHTFGACYADSGTLSFEKSVPSTKRDASVEATETITFSSTTPSTGQAEVSIDGVTSEQTLPTYGTCPHA